MYTGLVSNSGNILNNGVSKEMGNEIVRLVRRLSSLITGTLTGLNEEEISSNVFNGQRLAENTSRNNSTNVELSEDEKIGKVTNAKKDDNVIPNKYLVTNAKKDGDTGIYDQDGNRIGEALFDDTFIKYDVNGNISGQATNNTINFDVNITEKIDNFIEQTNDEYLLTWVYYNKSRSNHEYDLKKSGEIKDYDGYVYNSKIVSGRGAGNILFGRNIMNLLLGIDFILNKALKKTSK